jgi:hypothetical protein
MWSIGWGNSVVRVRISERMLDGVASQLGGPTGVAGRMVGRMLNHCNQSAVAAAVTATDIGTGGVAADVGFAGRCTVSRSRRP